jgi:iron-sulfur cluster assembly protein
MKLLPIRLTDAAIQEIAGIMDRKKIPEGFGLRIGAKGSSCSGTNFIIGFDSVHTEDEIFIVGGFPVYIEKKHFLHLIGMKVDFVEAENERGFIFSKDNL